MKLLTYNIHTGLGMDNILSLERIAQTILAQSPDLAAVNEIDVNCVRTNCRDQPQELGNLLKMNWYFGETLKLCTPARPEQGARIGRYGIAFFTPHRASEIHPFPLPGLPEMEPRIAVSVRINAPIPFYAIITHFCWEPQYESWRLASVKRIHDELENIGSLHPGMPIFLLGDLNSEPDSPTVNALRKNWTIANDGAWNPTHPADHPTMTIDYVMAAPRNFGRFSKVEVVPEAVASDHRPVIAEFELY